MRPSRFRGDPWATQRNSGLSRVGALLRSAGWPARRRWAAAVMLLALVAALGLAGPAQAEPPRTKSFTPEELAPLIDALQEVGFPRKEVEQVFHDDRLRKIDRVVAVNALNPDSASLYKQFTSPYALWLARRFQRRHRAELKRVERAYGVPKGIIVAILLVETQFGQAKLPYRVLDVFTTLAVDAHPLAIERHYDRLRDEHPHLKREWLASRLIEKAKFAFEELVAFLAMNQQHLDNLFRVRGSYAGAIGLPQFLPSSYLRWAVDGNGDGKVDLNQLPDAMASIANFLRQHGWQPGAGFREKWRAVWTYNRSPHYVRTIFEVNFRLSAPPRKRRHRS